MKKKKELFMSIADYAGYCGCSPQAVYLWIKEGRIQAVTNNDALFINVDIYGKTEILPRGRKKAVYS